MMEKNKKVGDFGENLAVKYLQQKNYLILNKNIKQSHQEIDILAYFKEKYIFVEVKTRIIHFCLDHEVMSRDKIKNLKKAIFNYLETNKLQENNWRADLILIEINKIKKTAKIKHYYDII